MEIQNFLERGIEENASDILLAPLLKPMFRIDGKMVPLDPAMPLSTANCLDMKNSLLDTARKQEQFNQKGDCDFSYSFTKNGTKYRFRVNTFQTANGVSFAMRYIKSEIPTLDSLYLPPVLKLLMEKQHGLILITGPTGSGKTTTLAAMLNQINQVYPYHIITIEDPIEFVHTSHKSVINQREVGQDVNSFSNGLKAALRQDPNVILVGEMRDKETIQTALNAAETGHLVLSSLHTSTVIEAVDRILQYFEGDQQKQIQSQLANCFEGIIAQKLLLRKDGKGRVAALEILLHNAATANLIRSGEGYQLKNYMNLEGMQTMEDSVKELKMKNWI